MTGLFFHLLPGASSSAVDRASTGARWLKTCDSGQIVRAHGHGCKAYWRPFLSERDAGDCGDGAAWAGEVWRDLQANGGEQPEAVGFRNEMNANVRNAAEYLRYRATLRSFGYRGLVALGSFAVGTPDWPEWALLKQGLAGNVPDCLEVHEYWDLTIPGSATYYVLRHVEAIRRGLLPPEWPIFVGECGSDGIWKYLPGGGSVPVEDPQGRRGWQDRGKLTAAQQSANLAAYDAGCAPSVVAGFVFADGTADPNWATFRTFDTPVEAAIRSTWPATTPQRAQDAPSGPVAAPTAPAPVVTPHAPVLKIGHAMPAQLFQFTQDAGSSDCWCEAIRSFFLRYGYPLPLDTVFQAGKGKARPAGGEAATFAEVKQAIRTLAVQLGVTVQMADFDDPATVAAALHDPDTNNPWTVIAGVKESDLQPGQNYGHFLILEHEDNNGMVQVVDSYTNVDGNQSGYYPFSQMATAMIDNWEQSIDAIGCKITGRTA